MTERKTIYLDDALEAIRKLPNAGVQWFVSAEAVFDVLLKLPSAEPERKVGKWVSCSERLPEKDDWYLGIFKESDTGWVNPIPQVCRYVGVKTGESTQDGWLLRNVDRHSIGFKYYMGLECVAWMSLPEPYQDEQK